MTLLKWTSILAISMIIQIPTARTGKTYVIDGQDRVTWDEAFKLCQERDMELVSVESAVEADRLRKILMEPPLAGVAKDFWTSGKLIEGNRWVWASTGLPITFDDWVDGAPNDYQGHDKCLRLWGLHGFRWDDFFCRAKLHFVCQKQAMAAPNVLEPRSRDRPDIPIYDEESDSEYDKVVTVKAPPEIPELQNAAIIRKERPKQTVQRTTPAPWKAVQEAMSSGSVLRLGDVTFVVVTKEALAWKEAHQECNRRQMELAVIGDEVEAQKIQESLRENELDRNSYWISYLHVRARGQRRPEQADQPSIQLTIGVKPGPGSFIAGAPTGQCPLLLADRMQMTFDRCHAKNYFICEKLGPY